MKKSELADEIKQLNKCLKDKDSRVTRIEERWANSIGVLIIISVGPFVIGYIIGCSFINAYLLDLGMNQVTSIMIVAIELAFPIAASFAIIFLSILLTED